MSFFRKSSKGQFWALDFVIAAAIFTLVLGLILAQSELGVLQKQNSRANEELSRIALLASNALVSKPEIKVSVAGVAKDARCHPIEWEDNAELSWAENCLVNVSGTLTPSALGLPNEYGISLSSSPSLALTTLVSPPPTDRPSFSVVRKVLLFPLQPTATEITECMQTGCTGNVREVIISVWRNN